MCSNFKSSCLWSPSHPLTKMLARSSSPGSACAKLLNGKLRPQLSLDKCIRVRAFNSVAKSFWLTRNRVLITSSPRRRRAVAVSWGSWGPLCMKKGRVIAKTSVVSSKIWLDSSHSSVDCSGAVTLLNILFSLAWWQRLPPSNRQYDSVF